jgi:hypothetical protein
MIVAKEMTAGSRVTERVKFPLTVATADIFRGPDGKFTPLLGPLMQRRWIVALLSTAVCAMVALSTIGANIWHCPLRSTLGVPCPGCGLTRAMVQLIQGNWETAISLHAFAPIVLTMGILVAAGSALPARLRKTLVARLTDFERRTGITALLILSALAYWILRIYH